MQETSHKLFPLPTSNTKESCRQRVYVHDFCFKNSIVLVNINLLYSVLEMLKFQICESHLILLELTLRNLDINLRMTLISTNKDDTLLFEHSLDTRT